MTPLRYGVIHANVGSRSLSAEQGRVTESPIKMYNASQIGISVNLRIEYTNSSTDDEILPAVLLALQV